MGAVFISYRRGDSEGQARALYKELLDRIGKHSIFIDVDSIDLGLDFRRVLQERLESCDLMLVLIGPDWLDMKDEAGKRRLDSSTDYVRAEIATALSQNISVTPVLLQESHMPPPERLPDDIRDLAYRHGFALSHTRWDSDVAEMMKRLNLKRRHRLSKAAAIAGVVALFALAFGVWPAFRDESISSARINNAPAAFSEPDNPPPPSTQSRPELQKSSITNGVGGTPTQTPAPNAPSPAPSGNVTPHASIENKTFAIENATSRLALVPIRETVHDNGGQLVIWRLEGNGVPDQRWRFVQTKHGYLIKNVESGMSLVPIRETVRNNGGQLVIWRVDDDGVPDQNWRLVESRYGYLLKNVASGLSLVPVRETVRDNGGKLVIWKVDEEGVQDQNWILREIR